MAIDVLSRENCVPIVVGDQDDMAAVTGVAVADDAVAAYLKLTGDEGVIHVLELSAETYRNFVGSDYSVLVCLSGDDIAGASLCPVNGKALPARALDEDEIKELAENLVSGDFRIEFAR